MLLYLSSANIIESHHSTSGTISSRASEVVIRANLVVVVIPVLRAIWEISPWSFSSWAYQKQKQIKSVIAQIEFQLP